MTSGRPLAATGRRPSMPRRRTTNDSATTNSAGRPTQPIECPRVDDVGRDRGHMTTPGRHGSTVTARSCDNVVGAPSGTPAMLREVGHGS